MNIETNGEIEFTVRWLTAGAAKEIRFGTGLYLLNWFEYITTRYELSLERNKIDLRCNGNKIEMVLTTPRRIPMADQ